MGVKIFGWKNASAKKKAYVITAVVIACLIVFTIYLTLVLTSKQPLRNRVLNESVKSNSNVSFYNITNTGACSVILFF